MTVGLEQRIYTVTEANTTIDVCATLTGDIADSVTVGVSTTSFLGTALGTHTITVAFCRFRLSYLCLSNVCDLSEFETGCGRVIYYGYEIHITDCVFPSSSSIHLSPSLPPSLFS